MASNTSPALAESTEPWTDTDTRVLAEALLGSRCQICGALKSYRDEEDGFCDVHALVTDTPESFLIDAAVRLQDKFVGFRRRSGPLPRSLPISRPQQKRWGRSYLLRKECRWSQFVMAIEVFDRLLAPVNTPVQSMQEVQFKTHMQPDGRFWEHWIYGVRMNDGSEYVLDLTGIQFGLDWPLLQDWDTYRRRVYVLGEVKEFGSQRDDLDLERNHRN
jgi:hypothetical protein